MARDLRHRKAAAAPAAHSWCYFDREIALRQARAADAALRRGAKPRALHGGPVAVKNVIDTAAS